jgi:tetratricopeptide (TPR) repeat protein
MDWFGQERDNLLVLLNGAEAARRIIGVSLPRALSPAYGPGELTLRLMRRAADAARRTDDVDAQGLTLLELGKAEFYFVTTTRLVASRAVGRIFEDRRDKKFLANVMMTPGQVWLQTGQHSDAHDAYRRALAAHEQEGNVRQAADVLVELDTVDYYADEYNASIRANQRALSTYEELLTKAGRLREARPMLDEAEALRETRRPAGQGRHVQQLRHLAPGLERPTRGTPPTHRGTSTRSGDRQLRGGDSRTHRPGPRREGAGRPRGVAPRVHGSPGDLQPHRSGRYGRHRQICAPAPVKPRGPQAGVRAHARLFRDLAR